MSEHERAVSSDISVMSQPCKQMLGPSGEHDGLPPLAAYNAAAYPNMT